MQDLTETDLPFAMYDAFTDVPYSGSQAAIILNATQINTENRVRIAQEIGVPATAFVNAVNGNKVNLQFFSTVMELPMCGHGTICLITRLVDVGLLPCTGDDWHVAVLDLPKGEAKVEYRRNAAGRIEVMLDVAAATFALANLDMAELAEILGIQPSDCSIDLPVEVASADFIHLCLPMRDLKAMANLDPDFPRLAAYCVANGLETVAAFCTQVVEPDRTIHVRDFCPAVGVAESAAAGTTNAALAAYLLHNNLVEVDPLGDATVLSEQGIELGRPSKVTTRIKAQGGTISRLQVGGVATKTVDGVLNTAFGAA